MPDNFFAETEQVAFMTQNFPPGVDFSNDPLPLGRNFSYLDTQLKRLGSATFTHIPINAPKCPFHHFQQDGHMAMRNPVGHVNYQPNSFGEGPRESPTRGFTSFPDVEQGPKSRLRADSFADHYSQARQFGGPEGNAPISGPPHLPCAPSTQIAIRFFCRSDHFLLVLAGPDALLAQEEGDIGFWPIVLKKAAVAAQECQ
jgi:hypothetical protein